MDDPGETNISQNKQSNLNVKNQKVFSKKLKKKKIKANKKDNVLLTKLIKKKKRLQEENNEGVLNESSIEPNEMNKNISKKERIKKLKEIVKNGKKGKKGKRNDFLRLIEKRKSIKNYPPFVNPHDIYFNYDRILESREIDGKKQVKIKWSKVGGIDYKP